MLSKQQLLAPLVELKGTAVWLKGNKKMDDEKTLFSAINVCLIFLTLFSLEGKLFFSDIFLAHFSCFKHLFSFVK